MSMALLDHGPIKEMSELVDALDCCERRKLLYLCGTFDTNTNTSFVKEFLKSKYQDHENGTLFLKELIWRLERFDILKMVYKVNRKQVEETLKSTQVLSRFRVLMVSISEDLDEEDLGKMKFLLSNTSSYKKMKAAETFLDVLIELEKLDSVSAERVDSLHKCFMNIGRVDLAKKIDTYKKTAETSGQHSSQQQRYRAPAPHNAARQSAPFSKQLEKNFNTNPRKVCVIIDCVGHDAGMLKQTFTALLYKVILYQALSSVEILSVLRTIFNKEENCPSDSFACCIISRGTVSSLLGTDRNGSGLPINSIRRHFTADACPVLSGKPKLFFIQIYRVPEYEPRMSSEDIESDGLNGPIVHNSIPVDADIFWSHCWTDVCQLDRQRQSFYMKVLTDSLHRAQTRKIHLVDAHTEVNSAIFEHNKKDPGSVYHIDLRHTLRKSVYLD